MRKDALVVRLALVSLGVSGSAVNAQQSGDACSLLKAAEIQALAGSAKVSAGKASTDALDSRLCHFEWGSGANVQGGESYLNVSVTPISKAFPGTDAKLVRQGLLASAGPNKPNAAVIPGVGDAAIYESNAPIRVVTTAMAKGNMLIIEFESADARARKDQVISLLKAAAGRL